MVSEGIAHGLEVLWRSALRFALCDRDDEFVWLCAGEILNSQLEAMSIEGVTLWSRVDWCRGKRGSRCIGPKKVLECVCAVACKLALPPSLRECTVACESDM